IPVGNLADPKLRALRKEAHDCFNRLYLSGKMSRDGAYAWLAAILQAPRSQAHIGYLSEYYCRQVIEESKKVFENQKPRSRSARGGQVYALDNRTTAIG
ncbi:MAG: DUF3268 family zinc-finger domain-containing protein, partial [Clostridiales bacterium]|nr:DUF3268 family zinc-finger domain-containing protein [Clostridiales bacterium]